MTPPERRGLRRTASVSLDRRSAIDRARLAPDSSVPVLLLRVGRYPLGHGALSAVRSLGRVGVPVHAVVEDRFTPTARSRHLTGRFVWPTTGHEPPEQLVARLREISDRLGARALLVATDDEAAVLTAEQAASLRDRFEMPDVPPTLPRRLASKHGLSEICRRYGVPAPATARASSPSELEARAAEFGFPVVVKNDDAWRRLTAPAVPGTTVVSDPSALAALTARWPAGARAVVQEYVPGARAVNGPGTRDSTGAGAGAGAEDWFAHVYCGRASSDILVFTGVKLRSWPPHRGVTSLARSAPNPRLADLTRRLCEQLGYRGIADLDWRWDRREGTFKLLDFNPRIGAQFSLFRTRSGVDVVRAMHLDLTGRRVPDEPQLDGRRFVVEQLDLPARIAYGPARRPPTIAGRVRGTERTWLAPDDPVPGLLMAARFGGPAMARLAHLGAGRLRAMPATRGLRRAPAPPT